MECFIRCKALVEKHFNSPILHLYSDNGGEYLKLRDFLSMTGISWLTTSLCTPQHNGCSERCQRHIVETGLSLLTHSSMPITYWTLSFATAVYLINRMHTPIIQNNTSYSKLFGKDPNYSKLKSFGCLCYPCIG